MRKQLLWLFLVLCCAIPAKSGTFASFQASVPACSQAPTYLARTSGGNEGGNAANITTLICGLVSDGVITGNLTTTGCGATLDVLYVFAQQNSTDALLNICGSNYTGTLVGIPTFTTDSGYSGFFTANTTIQTNFNPATAASPNYQRNSANFGVWAKSLIAETSSVMGTSASGVAGESNMFTDFTPGTLFYGRINSATGTAGSVSQTATKGLFAAERTSSSATVLYANGASAGGVTDTSSAPESVGFVVGQIVAQGHGTQDTLCEAHIGAALGATLNLALYNRLRTYMTAVGVP